MLAAAVTALTVAEVRAQSGVIESWRDAAGNWTGKHHALDPAGNLLVVGDTVVGDVIQVRKYSATGLLLWSRIYDPPERVVSYWIATDLGGNAWIAAARITGSQNSRVGFLVLKYDPQGNLVFVDATSGGLAVRVVTDAAGSAYVIGNGWFAGTLADNYMVVKYAPDGRRLWSGFLENGSSTFLAGPRSLALSPDETRLVVAGGGFSATWHALSVAMFDSASGQRLWNHVDTSKYGGQDAAFSPDGASVYVGNTELASPANAMALHNFDLSGTRIFSRAYTQGLALSRLVVDHAGNVVAIGTAAPVPGSGYRDWMTIKTDAAGALLWARRYDATRVNDEVPDWVTVDGANAVYVSGMGGPGPSTGNVSFLKPVTLKYDAAGTPIWATFNGGDIQVTVDDTGGGGVFTLYRGQMTSVRFEQTGSDAVPAAPAQLSATGSFNGVEFRVDLAWTDNATNEFSYAIERCAGAGCSNFVEIARALGENATGFRDAPVTSGATYTYRVRAVGFTGNSGYSNTATAMTTAIVPPATPSNLTAAWSGNTVQLSWVDNAADEIQFAIERCVAAACSTFTQIGAVDANVTSYVDTAVVGGQNYSYRVRAWESSVYSDYSNVAIVTTPLALPLAPTSLAASSTTRRQITLTWRNTAPNAASITVQRCTGSMCMGFVDVAQIAATATSWTDPGVKSGSRYRYRVYASNAAGRSPYSNIVSATAR
jgi:fibronectin type 3 domain-containing protein